MNSFQHGVKKSGLFFCHHPLTFSPGHLALEEAPKGPAVMTLDSRRIGLQNT
jgi:hypothetical protein